MRHSVRLASSDRNHYHNNLHSIPISLIIVVDFCWAKILTYQLHDSHTRSPIAATMCFPKTRVWMIHFNIMNSQHSPWCMDMTDEIIKLTNQQKGNPKAPPKIPNYHPSIHRPKCQKRPTHNTNLWITVHPVHSSQTMTNWQLGGCLYAPYGPKIPQREDSQCDGAHMAKQLPHQSKRISCNQWRDQEHRFWWIQGIAAAWESSCEGLFGTLWSLLL